MLSKRTIQLSFPKKPADAEPTEPSPYSNPETIIPVVNELVLNGAKLGFTLYAGVKVLNTICDIARIAAQAKL